MLFAILGRYNWQNVCCSACTLVCATGINKGSVFLGVQTYARRVVLCSILCALGDEFDNETSEFILR